MSYQLAEEQRLPVQGPGLSGFPQPLRERFLVRQDLGREGESFLFSVEERNSNSLIPPPLGLKVAFLQSSSRERNLSLFRREALSLLSLGGANTPKLYDYELGVSTDCAYLLFELPSESLASRLNRGSGRLPFLESCQAVSSVLSALKVAHRRGIIHRDIRPENVSLLGDKTYVLSGFGRASIPGERLPYWHESFVGGAVEALSPETIRYGETSPECDLYSVGILLYRLLSGKMPFQGGSLISIVESMQREDWIAPEAFLEEVPLGLNEMFRRALAQDPARRFHQAEEFLSSLEFVASNFQKGQIVQFRNTDAKSSGQYFPSKESAGFSQPLLAKEVEEKLAPGPENEELQASEQETSNRLAAKRARVEAEYEQTKRRERMLAIFFFALVTGVVGFSTILLTQEENPLTEAEILEARERIQEKHSQVETAPTKNGEPTPLPALAALEKELQSRNWSGLGEGNDEGSSNEVGEKAGDRATEHGIEENEPASLAAPIPSNIAIYAVRRGNYFGAPASVRIRLPERPMEEPKRIAINTGGFRWYLPVIPSPRVNEYWAIFPTPKGEFSLTLLGSSRSAILFNTFQIPDNCEQVDQKYLNKKQLQDAQTAALIGRENFLLAAYEMARSEPSSGTDFSVQRIELPRVKSENSAICSALDHRASLTMPLTLKPGQDQALHAKVVSNLEKRLRRLLEEGSFNQFNNAALGYAISDSPVTFPTGALELDEFAFRLNLLVIAQASQVSLQDN